MNKSFTHLICYDDMSRDEKITGIRPTLTLEDTDQKPIELFQNETLRPILKLQHELTRSLLRNHKNFNPDHSLNGTRQQYETYLTKYIQTNLDLKNQLLGAIIGLFTATEIVFYMAHRKELNKRMIQMQLKRFVDTEFAESAVAL